MTKRRIAIGGIHFPLSMMSYFIRAFRRLENTELFLFGPYTGDFIPWNNGMRIPQKYVVTPDFALPQSAIGMKIPSSMIPFPWTPDLTVLVDAGWHTADRPKGDRVVHIQTDPHVLKSTYALPKSYSDVSFCMQKAYMLEGESYLPYAFDPTVHYPMDEQKLHDACLIGLHYDHRDQLVDRLRKNGWNVYYSIGEVFDEYRTIYNQSKVALSWSSMSDTPARVFEAFGMKLPLVCNRTPDVQDFFLEGADYLGFSSLEEAVFQVEYLLGNDEHRETIAENGYKRAKIVHTWDARIGALMLTVGMA